MTNALRVQEYDCLERKIVIGNKAVYRCSPMVKAQESDSNDRLRNP